MTAGATPRARPRAVRSRSEGQWAHGYREPLNSTERFKRDSDGLDVRDRIINVYARNGFASIDPSDLRGRFRWYGLYTQRRPGIEGGRTAKLDAEDLEDSYFMLRVRIAGGQLSTAQLRVIGELSRQYARNTADITNRQNIQFHWVRIEDVPAIWEQLESVGLSTIEACGDTPRNMLGCPVAGIAADEVIDGTPSLNALAPFVGDPAFSNLPRKYKTAISGCSRHCTIHEINDVAFVGVLGPEGQRGFDLWVGGGLSTNPMYAQRLGVFVPPEQVRAVWVAVTSLFGDYGYRRARAKARLKFLLADWGTEKFRTVLQEEFLGFTLAEGPAAAPPSTLRRDHVGIYPQKDGRFYVGVTPSVGRTSGDMLTRVGELAERYGSQRVRTTIDQKLIILDVPEAHTTPLAEELEKLGLSANPSVFRRHTMACTGIEFCKLAIVNTKDRAEQIIAELERRLPDFEVPVTINVNGCPNSCARIQTADIGLRGQIITTDTGQHVEGFQVQLGGGLSADVGFGRKVRGLKVTADDLPSYIEHLLQTYQTNCLPAETFAAWVRRVDESTLAPAPR